VAGPREIDHGHERRAAATGPVVLCSPAMSSGSAVFPTVTPEQEEEWRFLFVRLLTAEHFPLPTVVPANPCDHSSDGQVSTTGLTGGWLLHRRTCTVCCRSQRR
jgi:hypothetical protein